MSPPDDNGWSEHKRLVEFRLNQSEKNDEIIFEKLDEISNAITTLKVKSGVWGALAGAIPIIIAFGVWFVHGLIQ